MRFPPVLTVLVFTTLTLHAQDNKPAAPKDKDFDVPKTWTLDVELVEKASGEQMPGVTLSARVNQQTRAYATDDRGHASIDYPADAKSISITLKHDGFVREDRNWTGREIKDLPDTLRIELERGTTVGGTVADEAGKPIAGANVLVLFQRKNDPRARAQNFYSSATAITDDQGKWACNTIPADPTGLNARVEHPDYISSNSYQRAATDLAKLRDKSLVMVMKKGVPINGRVTDKDGKPVAGARVVNGDRGGSNVPESRTDKEGRFHFSQNAPGDKTVLTVTAPTFAPESAKVTVDEDAPETVIQLQPGHTLKGRVVDAKGNPVPGVWIAPEEWRGNRMLPITRDRILTDADGRFEWNDAPPDEIKFSILKQGYLSSRDVPLKAGEKEHQLTLLPLLHVTGTVVDAVTGKPVEQFTVVHGIDWGDRGGRNQPVYWETQRPTAGRDGKFELDIDEGRAGHAVRVAAEDYLPAESRVFRDAETSVSLEFKLKKGAPLTGVVRGPDAKPVPNATVALRTAGRNSLSIRNGELTQQTNAPTATTDAQGRYTFPPQTGKFGLVVLHPTAGYTETSPEQLAKSADVTLQPWATVRGTLRIGATPGAEREISVRNLSERSEELGYLSHDLKATTDKDGHFTVERVPPGRTQVGLVVRTASQFGGGYTESSTQTQIVQANPGQSVDVNIGGTGRPVTGRVDVPPNLSGKFAWNEILGSISSNSDFPALKYPENFDEMDQAARKKFMEDQQKSPEYQNYRKAVESRSHFSVKFEPDGTFRVDDLPAGRYTLSVQINQSGGNFNPTGDFLGRVQKPFTIDPMPGDRSDDALDLGQIPLKSESRLKVGDPAPELPAVTSLDGKPLSLADHKGKYVVLNFWNVIYRPNPDDLPAYQATHAAFANDPRVVMLSVSLDQRIEWPKRFAAKHNLPWPQAHVAESDNQKLYESWSWRTNPTYIISPDGKLLATEVKPTDLKPTLEKLLPKPQ